MNTIYSFFISITGMVLKVLAPINSKLKLFVTGRKLVFDFLTENFQHSDRTIWLHAASLGEFEQGLPVLETVKRYYPSHKILLTFFSPSGYEVKKDSKVADVISYLPLDTVQNAKRFLAITCPELAIFVKYEIWPNFLNELEKQKIPTLLISAIFKQNQIYFKIYGIFLRNSLRRFSKIFVQNEESKMLLETIGYRNTEVSGDTRFDRVVEILEGDNHLEHIERFKGNQKCIVAGSSWVEDEAILLEYINSSDSGKFIIAPHTIKAENISKLMASITKKTALYSNRKNEDFSNFDVLIIDNIGLLTKIYSYADIAYVGGGFKTGLHNTLEPAVFGIPVIIGPNYTGFAEAEMLVKKGGLFPIRNKEDLKILLDEFLTNDALRLNKGTINSEFVQQNRGATKTILAHINYILPN
ncbi:3-deoxy-D-manno-octulosonic acid transferase [Croceivirga thetidis]|uniref:3-deoxy-D-manno-octulosonic acid transferase n=1 Tax=Croceivirga thetidis TaxID=2721623 RepID=A0ABX1GLC2_9FLAO|nr:glycosyltransferase N-terminal domain-containing protein [Croceivirga thetidis]NKI30698.1 3-deoxy-D-manno-octulosonic acid transferase [Croceivirga thetidis]